MTDFTDGQEYRVVLKSVPAQAVERVVVELTTLLPLDKAPAGQIAQAAPIVLLDKLNAVQARNADSHLGCIRRLGVDIAVTAEVTNAKRLSWPVMPEIVRHPANIFVCPSCGERLMVHSVGKPAMAVTVPPAKQEATAAPTKPAAAPAAPRKEPQPAKPQAADRVNVDLASDMADLDGDAPADAPAEPAAPKAGGRWSLAADADDDDVLEPLEELVEDDSEQPAAPPQPAAPKPAVPRPAPQSAAPQPAPRPAAPKPAAAQPAATKPAAQPAAIKPAAQPAPPRPAMAKPVAPAPKPAAPKAVGDAEITFQDEKAAAAKNPENGAGNFRVSFVAKLKPAGRKPVADLIAKFSGMTVMEALAATNKPVVTIMRNATKDQAEQCRKEFRTLGITVNVVERQS